MKDDDLSRHWEMPRSAAGLAPLRAVAPGDFERVRSPGQPHYLMHEAGQVLHKTGLVYKAGQVLHKAGWVRKVFSLEWIQ